MYIPKDLEINSCRHSRKLSLPEIRIRHIILLFAIASISACQTSRPSQSQLVLVPHGFGLHGGGNCSIEYSQVSKELHIYGQSTEENNALVRIVTGADGPRVRVQLSCGGVVTGQRLVREFPYYLGWILPRQAPEGPILLPEGPGTPTEGVPVPPTYKLVDEIYFHGSSNADYFENQTDIASHANGGNGANTLIGGSGPDWLYGGRDNDTLRGNDGNDRLYGRQGNDELYGGDGDDYLVVLSELVNESDDNTLCGGDGADYLVGNTSNNLDRLDGELAGGADDGDIDVLEDGTTFEFNSPPDILIVNGVELDPEDFGFPIPDLIPCS